MILLALLLAAQLATPTVLSFDKPGIYDVYIDETGAAHVYRDPLPPGYQSITTADLTGTVTHTADTLGEGIKQNLPFYHIIETTPRVCYTFEPMWDIDAYTLAQAMPILIYGTQMGTHRVIEELEKLPIRVRRHFRITC